MNGLVLLATAGMQVATTGEALSHPEYKVYVGITYAVVVVTLIGYGLWLQRSIAREQAKWEASGWDAEMLDAEEGRRSD